MEFPNSEPCADFLPLHTLNDLVAQNGPGSDQTGGQRKVVMVVDAAQEDRALLFGQLNGAYEVVATESGEDALEVAGENPPNIFMLSANLPGMDGYTLCRRIKADHALAQIPVIIVTSRTTTEDIVKGCIAGAVDHIRKPTKRAEVLARVETYIRLHQAMENDERVLDAYESNPLTRLPGNRRITRAIQESIDRHDDNAVIYCDLDHFKSFNDFYGFSRGDDALLFTARLLVSAMKAVVKDGEGFLGHIGGDDFVYVVPSTKAVPLGEEVLRRFDSEVPHCYDEHERGKGCLETLDRRGSPQSYPLMSITLAGVYLLRRDFKHFLEVASVCAQVKKVGKSLAGSRLLFDRRVSDPICGF